MKSDQPNQSYGKVILAGAGPGDPELITLKALRYLLQADVVISDRLVSPQILLTNTKAGAEIIFVGKQGGNDESISQQKINQLLVEKALNNKLVLRLKGGDVSFFSNVLGELETLTANTIPYEIIPGVTSASGAAAYAGIPLTARGYSTSVRFLTCYDPEKNSEELWKELANTNDTLVFYMSSEVLKIVVAKLMMNKISVDKEMAVIEQATTPFQKVNLYKLHEFHAKGHSQFNSPTMVIIGRVVGLHRKFNRIENTLSNENYFMPLKNLLPAD